VRDEPGILIVEDDTSLSKTMSAILRRKGYSVTAARDGLEAIEKVKEGRFCPIFMDVRLPLMNGVETYRMVKQLRADVVVVMMTAYAVEDLLQEALQEGAYGVLHKPLNMAEVLGLVEEIRGGRESASILVVDDDPGLCVTLKNILTRRGHRVGVAASGEEAIARSRAESYDIVFLDIRLPAMNGVETYLAMKGANPGITAVMMTAYRQEAVGLVDRALRNSARSCLYKPLDIESVLRLVDEFEREGAREN